MEAVLGECRRVLRPGRYAAVIVRDAYQDGRYLFTGADLAGAGEPRRPRARRATSSGTRPGPGCGRTAIRTRSSRTSPTSTSWSCAGSADPTAAATGRAAAPVRRSSGGSARNAAQDVLVEPVGPELDRLAGHDDVAEDHLVEPALLAVRAQDQPVRAARLEQLDLVALVEDPDLVRPELVGHVEQPDEPVADPPTLDPVHGLGPPRQRRSGRASDSVRSGSVLRAWSSDGRRQRGRLASFGSTPGGIGSPLVSAGRGSRRGPARGRSRRGRRGRGPAPAARRRAGASRRRRTPSRRRRSRSS